MNDLLEFPELGRVARSYTVYQAGPLSAKVAVALLDTTYANHAQGATEPADVISRVLRGWVASFTQYMPERGGRDKPLSEILGTRHVAYQLAVDYSELEDGAFALELKAKFNVMMEWYVGQGLRQAEQLRGLGQTAIVALAHAADAGLPILLPQTLLQMARGRKFLTDRLKGFPSWMMDAQPVERKAIEHLANPRRTMFTGRLARAILQVENAVASAKDVQLPKPVGRLTVYPMVVSWETGKARWQSALGQIMDTFRHEYGDQPVIYRLQRKPGARLTEDLQAFMSSIASTAPILRAADALVQVLARKRKDNDD